MAGAPSRLRSGGWLVLEHGLDQGAAVRSLLATAGFVDVATHLDLAGNSAVVTERTTGNKLSLRIGTAKTPPAGSAMVTWSAEPTSPFFCVEPWMGPPNAPGNQLGVHLVEPGQTQRFLVEVTLR